MAKETGMNDRIKFGKKHKDKFIKDVVDDDPSWLIWADKEIPDFSLTPDVREQCWATLVARKAERLAKEGELPQDNANGDDVPF